MQVPDIQQHEQKNRQELGQTCETAAKSLGKRTENVNKAQRKTPHCFNFYIKIRKIKFKQHKLLNDFLILQLILLCYVLMFHQQMLTG